MSIQNFDEVSVLVPIDDYETVLSGLLELYRPDGTLSPHDEPGYWNIMDQLHQVALLHAE